MPPEVMDGDWCCSRRWFGHLLLQAHISQHALGEFMIQVVLNTLAGAAVVNLASAPAGGQGVRTRAVLTCGEARKLRNMELLNQAKSHPKVIQHTCHPYL